MSYAVTIWARIQHLFLRGASVSLCFSAAFAAPNIIRSISKQSLNYRSVAIPLHIKIENVSLGASAFEDVQLQLSDVQNGSLKGPGAGDRLRAGERNFRINSIKINPSTTNKDLFYVPNITIADYALEAENYEPRSVQTLAHQFSGQGRSLAENSIVERLAQRLVDLQPAAIGELSVNVPPAPTRASPPTNAWNSWAIPSWA